jgi:hypothetical protein
MVKQFRMNNAQNILPFWVALFGSMLIVISTLQCSILIGVSVLYSLEIGS